MASNSEEKVTFLELATHSISGSLSGVFALLVWYPLETLRIRINDKIIETSKNKDSNIQDDEFKENTKKHSFYNKFEVLRFALEIIKKEKIKALYNGLISALVGIVITQGTYFFFYRMFKILFQDLSKSHGVIFESLLTSLISAIATSILSNPIWVLNSRMAKKQEKEVSNLQMILKIYKEEGIGGFFKGLIPSLVLCSNPMIQYTIYEKMKENIISINGELSSLNIIYISFVSKLITTILTYPILTIKTLFQSNETKEVKQLINTIINLLKESGFLSLYKGISAKICQTIINNILLMLMYEKIQDFVKIFLMFIFFGNR